MDIKLTPDEVTMLMGGPLAAVPESAVRYSRGHLVVGDDYADEVAAIIAATDIAAVALAAARAEALAMVSREAERYRTVIAGDISPAKAAEYADKARTAERILNGEPVSAAAIAEAKSEMVSLGLAASEAEADPAVIAALWRDKATALVAARARVNVIERQARAAVEAAADLDSLDAVLASARAEAEAALAGWVAEYGD